MHVRPLSHTMSHPGFSNTDSMAEQNLLETRQTAQILLAMLVSCGHSTFQSMHTNILLGSLPYMVQLPFKFPLGNTTVRCAAGHQLVDVLACADSLCSAASSAMLWDLERVS
jgi:hypothetical protein